MAGPQAVWLFLVKLMAGPQAGNQSSSQNGGKSHKLFTQKEYLLISMDFYNILRYNSIDIVAKWRWLLYC